MTPAQELCAAAGLTVKKAAKQARIQPSYLSRCIRKGCPTGTAEAIVDVLHCDPDIFIWGYAHWKDVLSGHTGVARSDAFDRGIAPPAPPSQRQRRGHILRIAN